MDAKNMSSHYLFVYYPLTQDGATPLYIASEKGHDDVVNTLLKNGARINLARNVCGDALVQKCIIVMLYRALNNGTHSYPSRRVNFHVGVSSFKKPIEIQMFMFIGAHTCY